MTIKDTSPRLRQVASTLLPAAAVVAFQIAFFPLPLGVALQGVIIGLLGALVAVGMALVYRANRILISPRSSWGSPRPCSPCR